MIRFRSQQDKFFPSLNSGAEFTVRSVEARVTDGGTKLHIPNIKEHPVLRVSLFKSEVFTVTGPMVGGFASKFDPLLTGDFLENFVSFFTSLITQHPEEYIRFDLDKKEVKAVVNISNVLNRKTFASFIFGRFILRRATKNKEGLYVYRDDPLETWHNWNLYFNFEKPSFKIHSINPVKLYQELKKDPVYYLYTGTNLRRDSEFDLKRVPCLEDLI